MNRRLEDRIRDLCAKAISLPQSPELEEVLKELQEALREHTQRARQKLLGESESPNKRLED